MKTKIFSIIITSLILLSACEKDGNLYQILGLKSSGLEANNSSVTLSDDNATENVLAFTWDESTFTVSDTSVKLPTYSAVTVLQISLSSTFDSLVEINASGGNSFSFQGSALNELANKLKCTPKVSTPVYFRIKAAYADNTEPKLSNTFTVNITCFKAGSVGIILDSKQVATQYILYAPENDGEYLGFTGASAWYNWFLKESDGSIWGNLPADGNAFVLSKVTKDNTPWNFWYPGLTGCYYTTLSTKNEAWTATLIPSLNISGDVSTALTFDKANVKWFANITTTSNNAKIKISGSDAKYYDKATSTDDGLAIAKTIGFMLNSDSTVSFDWNNASATDINIATAGDYTVTLNLINPKKWTLKITSGKTVVTKPLSKKLYLMGIDDVISGGWNFNTYLNLVNEDDSSYVGVVNVNSQWGYQMALDSGEWSNVYKKGATDGTLSYKTGPDNIPAPTPGVYLIKVSLKNLTYSYTAVTSLSYAGLNDNWTLVAMNNEAVGIYSAPVTITAASQWGCKLYFNNAWDDFYGGKDGVLAFGGNGITDDAAIGAGSYDLIANTQNNTYVFLSDKVYIGGLNDVWDFTSVVLSKTSAGVYTGTATINAASSWGIKIYLYNNNWDRYYGGSFSKISYLGSNITDDKALATGTYTITVNFLNNTCAFVKN